MPEDHGWNDSPIDGTLQCITCGIWYKLCKIQVPKTHTLLLWWIYDHCYLHLQVCYSAWLHLSTWDFWHPLTSHDSHPFHITQGIFPSFFSHLPVQNFLLPFGKPIPFLSVQCSRDSKLVSTLPLWTTPLSHCLWADSNFSGATSFTRPLVSSFCFPGMGMLDTILCTK